MEARLEPSALCGDSLHLPATTEVAAMRIFALPSLRQLSQLRALLPYAAKLLPVLTGISTTQPTVLRPDFSSLNRHFGEIQSESRGLRSQVEGQGEQIEQVKEQLDRIASHIERSSREQEELAKSFRSLASLLKGLFFAILFLLVAVTALSGLVLFRLSHL